MDKNFGIKELYDVSIRLCAPAEIGGKKYDVNEAILTFKTAEIAELNQNKEEKRAMGGWDNLPQVFWETDREMNFAITHGVLSPKSWAILSNSKLKNKTYQSISYNETLHTIEDDDYCYCDLKYIPNHCLDKIGAQPNPEFEPLPMGRRPELMLKPLPPSKTKFIFCYDIETGRRIHDFQILQNRIYFTTPVRKVYIDYTFNYEDKFQVIEVGNRLLNCFLSLTGKMSVKDENSGQVTTAILEIPKIKLSSSLSTKLGKNYENSIVSDFFFTGYPEQKNSLDRKTICKITFLNKELTEEYI